MSAVTLRPREKASQAARAEGRGRRFWRLALGVFAQAAGVSAAMIFGGCDQYVVYSLQNLPATGSVSVRTLYQVDTIPDRKGIAWVDPPLDKFALKLPGDAKGMLTTTVQAYSFISDMDCYQAMAVNTVPLDGSHEQDLMVSLPAAQTKIPCDATHVAVKFPPTDIAPLATWGDSRTNVWVVGDQGAIFHWDGKSLAPIPLPADLIDKPPTWRAVAGFETDNVWVAGDRGVVAHWDGTKLTTVNLVAMGGAAATLSGDALPNWVSLSLADPAQNEVFFVSSNGYIGHHQPSVGSGVQVLTDVQPYAVYPMPFVQKPMSKTISFSSVFCISTIECWLVGYDPSSFAASGQSGAGVIFQVYNHETYSDYSMLDTATTTPLTRNRLRGVWGTFFPAGGMTYRRFLYLVGENATVLYSQNSLAGDPNPMEPTVYPKFQNDYSALAVSAVIGKSQKLNVIGGSSVLDLWIAGDSGLLMRWDITKVAPANPFSVKETGVSSNFTSLFSTPAGATPGRVYLAGDHQTFLSPD